MMALAPLYGSALARFNRMDSGRLALAQSGASQHPLFLKSNRLPSLNCMTLNPQREMRKFAPPPNPKLFQDLMRKHGQ
jgi:hypothetical protein